MELKKAVKRAEKANNMGKIKNFIIFRFVKSFLDSLPLNNKKTYLGIALFVLSIVSKIYPDNPMSSLIQDIIELLKSMQADDFMNVSMGVIATGLAHKWLKKEDKPE